ncbi:RpnC/YadD family protein [Caedibacter taeniospiralis]|uniref:hypothetical protein n=1 Tax=Caedibacter taeniospiralis TaxID=28907 RepID=UPI000C27E7EC|nr:hypothetical protein [Caedibacter taeniospiralis]
METEEFYDRIIHSKPNLKGDVMTVAEKWEQQGVQKGIQQGRFLEKEHTAKAMLTKGLSDDLVVECTGLDRGAVLKLKKELKSKTQH